MTRLLAMIREGYLVRERRLLAAYLVATGRRDQAGFDQWKRALRRGRRAATDGLAPVKCAYCGRYGVPGQCEGCGAPNQPAPSLAVSHRELSYQQLSALARQWEAAYSGNQYGRVAVLYPPTVSAPHA